MLVVQHSKFLVNLYNLLKLTISGLCFPLQWPFMLFLINLLPINSTDMVHPDAATLLEFS